MSVGSWINSFLAPAAGLARRVPGRVWLAVGCLLIVSFWVQQHDAGVRRQAQLQQVRQQASAEVAALKKQAEQAEEKANVENAKALQKLEARRQQIEQQNQKLAAQLAALRKQEQAQADEVATLPIPEIVAQVATQLGLKAGEDVVPPSSTPPTPHPAAGASTLSPGRGLDHASSADIAGSHGTGVGAVGISTPASPRHETDAVATNETAMALTGSGARKVEQALVELKACRAESDIQSQQVSNCQARAEADDATIQRQAGSIASLNQALAAKDQILSKQENEYKAELRAAKGMFWSRLARVAKHVAIGVGIGVVIGVAAR